MIPKHKTRGVFCDALAHLVPLAQDEYFRVEVGRNTVLRCQSGAEIHGPAFFLHQAESTAETHLKVSTSTELGGLFAQGLHTKATGRCLNLHYAIQVSRMDGQSHFDPPLFVDIPCPKDRWVRSHPRLYGWGPAKLHIGNQTGWEWQSAEGQIMPRIRKFNRWYYRILLYDDTWASCLYPFSQENKRCMISVDLEGLQPEDAVQLGVRVKGSAAWIPLQKSGRKWVGMALPSGRSALLWALCFRAGRWSLAQIDISALGNQKWTLSPRAISESGVHAFLQTALQP